MMRDAWFDWLLMPCALVLFGVFVVCLLRLM